MRAACRCGRADVHIDVDAGGGGRVRRVRGFRAHHGAAPDAPPPGRVCELWLVAVDNRAFTAAGTLLLPEEPSALALRALAELLRAVALTRSELETRQGWVVNALRSTVAR